MWTDTKDGFEATLVTKKKETVKFSINRQKQLGVIERPTHQQVIFGVRDNKVKLWNDQIFDPMINGLIRSKMEATVLKKVSDVKKGR